MEPPEDGAPMSTYLQIRADEVGDVTVVHFRDNILEDANVRAVRDDLFTLVHAEHQKKVLLNFSGVEFVSSRVMEKLIALKRIIDAQHGKLVFCCLRPEIYNIFQTTNLTTFFDIEDTDTEALAAF